MKKEELEIRIRKFLITYAGKTEDDEYTSPDAGCLEGIADMIKQDLKIYSIPFSEWGSGGYKPYLSKEGREEHDFLIREIEKIIELKPGWRNR